NVDKVYDWIVEESTGTATIPIGEFPITIPVDATNVKVKCMLTDELGNPIPINSELDVMETSARQDHRLKVGGMSVTLQRVSFTKTLYAVLEVRGVDPATGNQFLVTSDAIPFNFFETALLCAPAGTNLLVKISNFDCLTFVTRNEAGEITDFGLNISICQSIQTVAPVTVEMEANLCNPRREIIEHCATPGLPGDCSAIFPED
ncbi:MAG TPA: hypothetical protein VK031_10165, partial [Tissierellaceae bacterium]|nr:hypothetical protein [Tissierellaceae bacterium]